VSENGEEDIIDLSGKSDFLSFSCYFFMAVRLIFKTEGPTIFCLGGSNGLKELSHEIGSGQA
jgi:hypothetical protein